MVAQSKASHADIGYSDGLLLSTSIEVYKSVYLQGGIGKDIESYGIGAGYDVKNFNFALFANKFNEGEGVEFKVNYYDIGPSFFFSFGNKFTDEDSELTYKVGVGYPIREGVSLITHYSNRKLFMGIRSYF